MGTEFEPEIRHGMVVAGHLGGYVPGGDPDTNYPDLWRWLVEGPEQVSSVLDVGAGDGVAVDYFLSLGIDAQGIEGIEQKHPRIWQHDFAEGPYPDDGTHVDLVWSCEFVEHVAEEFVPNFLESFKRGRLVLITHAEPGQNGWHHVNLQHGGYWIEKIEAVGFRLDLDLTNRSRELARLNTSPWNHYARSGLAFKRREESPVADHERLIQGESEIREEAEEAAARVDPAPETTDEQEDSDGDDH